MKLFFCSSQQRQLRVVPILRRWLNQLAAVLLWVGMVQGAWANNYKVTVDAPKEVKETLQSYLDIVRYQTREDIRDEYLDFLIDQTPEQAASLLATLGYFDARTEVVHNNKEDDGAKPDLTVKVSVGSRVMVESAKLEVQGLIKQQDPKRINTLEFDWSLQEDEPFTQNDWSLSKTLLLRKTQSEAYAAARFLKTKAYIDPDTKKAQLSATLDSGPYFTLGEIDAAGLRRYPASVVKNVNVIKVGEAYNRQKLLDLQKRLQNLPYFSSVLVDIEQNPDDAQLTPIKVKVVELPTQNFTGLLGYGTDAGYRANVQYSHYNVFKRGWIFDTKYDWQQEKRTGTMSLTTPQNSKHFAWSLAGKVEDDLTVDVPWRESQIGLHYGRKLERTALSYDLDYFHSRFGDFNTHATVLGVSWTKNNVDNPAFPRKGYAIETSIGGASKNAGSTASFLRLYGRYRYFIPFLKSDSLLLRAEAGAVISKDSIFDVPSSLTFFAGGSSSIRGYSYQAIGVEYDGETGFPGQYLGTASAEYTHWFNKSWGAAAFYDVGTVTNSLTDVKLYQGFGLGARWHSPVGPIHFDLAYGYPRKKLSPHISIGILF
ncbi:autotransporter assembly complex protein TamA [Hydromonas duriensis]|uniref:Autotransporter secretion outer membrane protein TamA n=1 Tax=Hydromonas duriensis TaxID=1527608 RepID=A0A4R6YBR4_9BURK|nr:BamA/TamA family outer membrane protein [Hydromonas duriensis]TDR33095.1 autotransporter secretion outer membrane protein TamA [Hydromonas duriensis]